MTGALQAWLCGLVLALAGCALPGTSATTGRVEPIAVADGVYMVRGQPGEVDPSNGGRVGNSGFIVGPRGVIAIDAGTSVAQGRELLAAIARITPQPVRLLLISHIRQEFLFGAAAFQQAGVPVQMHRQSELLMKSRCEHCLKVLKQVVGDAPIAGTVVIKPDRVFDASHAVDLIGRPVRVHYFGHSSGPGDIAVEDVDTATLFAGGLLDNERVPDVQDSDLPGWHRALDGLRARAPRHVVPGHGPAGDSALIERVDSYLRSLERRAAELVKSGAALSEVPDAMDLPAYAGWDQYELIHRRNASIVFLRLERDLLLRPEGAAR